MQVLLCVSRPRPDDARTKEVRLASDPRAHKVRICATETVLKKFLGISQTIEIYFIWKSISAGCATGVWGKKEKKARK